LGCIPPGMGQLSVTTAQQGDVPMVMGSVLVIIVFVLVVNLLGDLANAALNPRARTR
jgi:peptide/nickel transport system permease protein